MSGHHIYSVYIDIFLCMLRVWRMFGEGQYFGDEAAEWFSKFLNKPGCKMYHMSQPRLICTDDKWGDVGLPDDKVLKY